ncbi:MAG: hypothetical protein ACI9R3_003943 [Verrucomicrobiales bacterium]|jgi:hypothetical protein
MNTPAPHLAALRPVSAPGGNRFVLAFLAASAALSAIASAQVPVIRINEVLAANDTTNLDNTDFDDYADWIELHNTNNQSVSLNGYYLTDDLTLPARWKFPTGALIPANGYLLVWADGFDAGPGERHVRTAAPWDSFTTRRYHTNFKLGSTGESVGLFQVEGGSEDLSFVSLGADWKYFDKGTDPRSAWNTTGFNDSTWSSGAAQLGYGENDEATTISFGSDNNNKYPAYYFRHSFSIADTADLSEVTLLLLADDGAIVYLNGSEVARVRMPAGEPTFDQHASSQPTEDVFDEFTLSPGQIRAGENLIAVEVHQINADSSDVSFDLSLTGTRIAGPATLVDSVTFGVQRGDISYGRDDIDPENWVLFGEPTPNAANTTIPTLDPTPSTEIEFSTVGGFFSDNQQIALSTAPGIATIRYTLDGSKPSSSSPAYGSPISITKTSVVRARTFETDKVPGKLSTQTYFINEPARDLPVVSFVVEPETFFDNTLGIYKNVYKDREAPVSLEYFDGERNLAFKVNAGAKIGGENIWRFAQKPLNIAMRGKYGDDLISYKIFPDENEGTFAAIGFRNGGDNWSNAMLRDPMAPSIVRGQMENDVGAYRPCVLYMNGEYWGIHNVRERHGDTYFFNRYHINAGDYDLLVKEHTINGTELVLKEGFEDAYIAFEDQVKSTNLANAENYETVGAQMDIDSLIDYAAMVDFVYESSWHHNQEFWRERKPGAKWRWTINDIDRGFNGSNADSSLIDDMLDKHPIFKAMAANTEFKNRFVQRYAAHIGSTFHPDRIAEIIDRLSTEVDPEIPRHIARWKSEGGISSVSSRKSELDEIKKFAVDRLDQVYSDTSRILGTSSATATLTVNTSSADAGRVLINGVPILPQFTNQITLFRSIAFDLTAESAPGFEFSGWSTGDSNGTISQTLTGNATVTANFRSSNESIIPAVIDNNTTLSADGSPFTTSGDVTVASGQTLSIEPGVVIRMPEGASFYINGSLNINGTEDEPVVIESRNSAVSWGAVAFVNATGTSTLAHFKLVGASFSTSDPVNLKAAVSNFHSTIVLEHADISAPFPVFARGGSTTVRNSVIHPQYTGDGINIKGGSGLVEDSTFVGNESPDTDAIDFDNVVNGVIQRNRIYGFRGFNSDAVDVGEGCVNLLLFENKIYNSSDKGISVGQGSVVVIRRNLVVGCALGVGIKDTGSRAIIDQNTFAQNGTGVAVFEKNLDKGGGEAVITNTIFSRSKDAPVSQDAVSTLSVSFSLSDTIALPGVGNLVSGVSGFVDAGSYDFSLLADSPAINAGDPAHEVDADGSRADIGALYVYDPDDYPYRVPNVVVINEVLSHSHDAAPDWIELYNTSRASVDISGWYLSDSASDLMKFRIPEETILEPNSYMVFYEDTTFGETSTSPGRITPFALSENGESVYVFAPGDGFVLDYFEQESFGPSPTGVSKGRYLKSTRTYNFVSMQNPTPGTVNSAPLVGPIVISEIMYKPKTNGAAEYVELANISGDPVLLYDEVKDEPWRFTNAIEFDFPTTSPVTMAPGEHILIVRNESAFRSEFTVPDGARVFQWTAGGLKNGGEQIEFSSPGDVVGSGVRQWYRIDRVSYTDVTPWPAEADGGGMSLTRIAEAEYGNDVINWKAAIPTPGASTEGNFSSVFAQWAAAQKLPSQMNGFSDDADGDGTANGIEFAFGTDPVRADRLPEPTFAFSDGSLVIEYPASANAENVEIAIQVSQTLQPDSWAPLETEIIPADSVLRKLRAVSPGDSARNFYRVRIAAKN